MNPHLKKLSNFSLLYIFTLLILILLPIRPAFSGNTLSVDSMQGSSFTLYYDLISMDSENLFFTTNPSMNTTISPNPFIVFGNLKGCEFDGMGGLNVLGSGGFSFDVFALSFSKSNITLQSISIPSGSTFTPAKGSSGLVIGHFSWSNPPQDDETNVAAFEASLGSTKIGKRNQRLLKIYTYSQSQSGLSSSATRKKLTKSNASNSNYKKSSTLSPISQQQDEMPYLCYYDISINAYGGVYVFADLDSSDIPPEVYPIEINFDTLQGGTQPDPSYSTIIVYRGKTVSFNVNASNSSASTTQTFALKQLSVPVGASFTDPSPLKGGDSLSGIFQWPVSGDVEDGTYTAIFGAYLSSGSTSLSPTLLILNIKVQEEPANIELTPSQMSFNGTVGGSNPAPQTLTLKNTGGADLNWTASKNASWLTLSKTSGSLTGGNSDSITVSVNISGQQPGQYSDTITISDPNASNNSQTVQVTLGLTAPAIGLGSQSISFSGTVGGPNPASQTLSVWNSGSAGTTLNWTAQASTSTGGPWLSITPTSGTSTGSGDPKTITVSVNISGLSAGTYNGTITISDPNASNNPQKVSVTLTLTAPAIGLGSQSISFSGTVGVPIPASQTLSVSNAGPAGTTLNWTAQASTSSGGSWLSITPTSGQCTGGDPKPITVSAAVGTLQAGIYNGTITISDPNASNNSQIVQVTLTLVAPPAIGLDKQNISFSGTALGSNPASQTFSVWNSGGGTLSWSATPSTSTGGSWLSINPSSGSSTGSSNKTSVTVSATVGSLAAGTYNGTITISDPNASNNTQTVSVILTLAAAPASAKLGVDGLDPTSGSLSFTGTALGSNPAPKALSIYNNGGGTLSWSATASTSTGGSWLSINPSSGSSTGSSNKTSVTVSATVGSLAAGTYNGTITITHNGSNIPSPLTIPVSLTLSSNTPPPPVTYPQLGVDGLDPTSGSIFFTGTALGSNPAAKPLSIYNNGSGTLSWSATVSTGGSWLSINPSSGSSTGSSNKTSVTVSATIGSLAAGTYNGTITITHNGTNIPSPLTIPVSLTLTGSAATTPLIGLNTQTLTFNVIKDEQDDDPAGQTLTISNIGVGTLNWTATAQVSTPTGGSWLIINPNPTTGTSTGPSNPTSVTVSATLGSLAVGTYNGTIIISDPNASPNSQTVQVTFNVYSATQGNLAAAPDNISLKTPSNAGFSNPWFIKIWNNGDTGIPYEIEADQPWVRFGPLANLTSTVSGTLPPRSDPSGDYLISGLPERRNFLVSINPGDLPKNGGTSLQTGLNTAHIKVYQGQGDDKSWVKTINLYFYIGDDEMRVAPNPLLFSMDKGGSSPSAQTLEVINPSQTQGMNFSVSTTSSGWLSASPSGGSIGPNAFAYVTVRASGLATEGTYDGQLKVTSNGLVDKVYYTDVVFKVHRAKWDMPSQIQSISPVPTITPVDSHYYPDSSYFGLSGQSVPVGGDKYYVADTSFFTSTGIDIYMNGAGGSLPSVLQGIRMGDAAWVVGASSGGIADGFMYNVTSHPNRRIYVDVHADSCPSGCSYYIEWLMPSYPN